MEQNINKKILLHACCGICSGYPISMLKEMGYHPVVYFYNSNIDTQEEFNQRLEAQRIVCKHFETDLIVENYNHNEFLNAIKGYEPEPEKGKRCEICIKQRLEKTAQKATELGIDTFTTSLSISPHKNFEKISEIGCVLSDKFLPINFRKKDGFLKTNSISKELNLYRQRYCGCEFCSRG